MKKLSFILSSLVLTCYSFADSIPTQATYLGFSPGALSAKNGDESLIEIDFDKGRVSFGAADATNPASHNFKTVYGPSWVFSHDELMRSPLRDIGSNCTAVKQHPQSNLAQFIVCFSQGTKKAEMILGEGMPMVLGNFVRVEGQDFTTAKKEIQTIKNQLIAKVGYASLSSDQGSEIEAHIRSIDEAQAQKVLSTGSSAEKVSLMSHAGEGLWTARSNVVDQHLAILAAGLHDSDDQVKIEVLKQFELGARVTGGVKILTDFLATPSQLSPAVLKEAVEAANCLLYETHTRNVETNQVRRYFGTTDLVAIHQKSGGYIPAELEKQIEALQRSNKEEKNLQIHWTNDQELALKKTLAQVVSAPNVAPGTLAEAARGLSDYR